MDIGATSICDKHKPKATRQQSAGDRFPEFAAIFRAGPAGCPQCCSTVAQRNRRNLCCSAARVVPDCKFALCTGFMLILFEIFEMM
jgi:hypothetical protein